MGTDFYWKLPAKNRLSHLLFNKTSRICADETPSVLIEIGKPTLHIRLPSDMAIFASLISQRNVPCFTSDPRSKIVQEPFEEFCRSNVGRYLSGFLDMFGDLGSAYGILEQRYWRRMFQKLSHQSSLRDENRLVGIRNKLKKHILKYGRDFKEKQDDFDWLSRYVLHLSKQELVGGRELTFHVFLEEARAELDEFNTKRQEDQKFEFDEDDVRRALAELVESKVILLGIRPKCIRCGYRNWYHIDESKQTLHCKGCGYEYSASPEERWYYKLNSLVQAGCAQHGLIPIVLVLGQLQLDSRCSFFYVPCLDIFKQRDGEAFTDIDIVCIQDGKFIIGEVKQSTDLFDPSHFDTMAEVAERLKPDILLFSSLEAPNRLVNEKVDDLKKRLSKSGIDVIWYELRSYTLEAQPVR